MRGCFRVGAARADGRLVQTAYDGDSNVTSITLPSNEASYTP
jgi:YD repeat-containing protein